MAKRPEPEEFPQCREAHERAGRRAFSEEKPETLAEASKLIHGLRIRLAELEIRKEELARAQAQSETALERYRHLYEFAPAGYVTLNRSGWITSANLVFSGMSGYDRNTLARRRFSTLVAEADHPALQRLLHRGETAAAATAELRFARRDATEFWALVRLERSREQKAGVVEFRLSILDITDRKFAEHKLKEMTNQLRQKVAEQGNELRRQAQDLRALALDLTRAEQRERQRLASVLHDNVQQVLAGARIRLGTVKADAESPEQRSAAAETDDLVKEAIQMTRSLAVELSPPALRERGLKGGLEWLAGEFKHKNSFEVALRFDNRAEPSEEDCVLLLFECVRELVFNAVKHSGAKRAEVTVTRTDEETAWIVVEDKGKGFDAHTLGDRRERDSSLGLFSIEQRLAHLGGQMTVSAAPGQGTRVELLVPVGPRAEPGERPATEFREKKRNVRVLIVDDHEILREGVSALLNMQDGIEVVGEAGTGCEAIRFARSLKPDVIVMDLGLPGMDGIETTRRLRDHAPSAKVIGLSMNPSESASREMLDAGAREYLTKGGPCEDLIAAIRRIGAADEG